MLRKAGWFGAPDKVMNRGGNPYAYAYFYNRFAKKDWVVIVVPSAPGYARIGWNAVSALDWSEWEDYVSDQGINGQTMQPTRPANGP